MALFLSLAINLDRPFNCVYKLVAGILCLYIPSYGNYLLLQRNCFVIDKKFINLILSKDLWSDLKFSTFCIFLTKAWNSLIKARKKVGVQFCTAFIACILFIYQNFCKALCILSILIQKKINDFCIPAIY